METEVSLRKGSRRRVTLGGLETAIQSKLPNKTKMPRVVRENKKHTEETQSDNEKGRKTRGVLRSNKSEENFPKHQIKDEIQIVKKAVKHKKGTNPDEDQSNAKARKIQSQGTNSNKDYSNTKVKKVQSQETNPGEDQPHTKARKIPSPGSSLTDRKKISTERPVNAVTISPSKDKQKAPLISQKDSPVENRKLGHKSKKAAVKSGESSENTALHGSTSTAPGKSCKKPKVAGITAETPNSNKKKVISKQKEGHEISKTVHVGKRTVTPTEVDSGDPMALLMLMEGRGGNAISSQLSPVVPSSEEQELNEQTFTGSDGESEEMSDWEDVYDHQVADRSQIPSGPVEITLELPDILKRKKRQKPEFDWKAHLERRVKRFKKQVAVDMHKVHLLCLLSLGLQQNDVLNDHTVRGVLLSLLPASYLTSKKLKVQAQVENLLLWHKRHFPQENIAFCSNTKMVASSALIDAVSQNSVTDARVWILLFICLLRMVGLTVRLVLSFQPMRFKAHQGWDEKKGGRKKHRTSTDQSTGEASGSAKNQPKSAASTSTKKQPQSAASTSRKTKPEKSSSAKLNKSQTTSTKEKPERATSSAKSSKSQTTAGKTVNRRLSQRESSKKATLKNKNVLTGDSDADDENYASDDETAGVDNSDSDFSERGIKKLKEIKKKSAVAQDDGDNSRKILSPSTSDDEAAGGKRHGPVGHDIWLEVYFPESKKWICFNCFKSEFGKPYSLGNSATQPLMYILGFKNDNSVKDVTARYSRQWLSHTRKNRIDQEWWAQTLLMFDKTCYNDNLLEDDEIKSQLLVQPMPTSIAEFKSHPLYALRRHLLKFEAVYPDSAVPLGYIKKEPVYARECIRVLHSRDNWLKEGRLVRVNEQPYKMVKSRPKWNKPKEDPDALDLQLFGEWQTEKYIPPPAVNGKVPRNEYGNVELFKPWMLPLGTVQVRGQGLQKIAKKLNIDVAAAMVGWDSHSGHSHPVFDGWIVCEEFADTLMAAWLEDQEIQKQREQERKDKQVYDNWRRLIRGLLIRERLKTKFLQEAAPVPVEKVQTQETFSDAEEACDVQQSWPRNRQDELKEHQVKAVEAKIEKERKLLMKELCNNSKILNTKVQNNNKNVGSKLKKVQAKKVEVKSKRKIKSDDDSTSSSSSEDDIVSPKLSQRKVNKIRNSVEEEDPDFVVGEKKVNLSRGSKNLKDKRVAGDEGKVGDRILGESNRRTSLARQVKRKVKLVDASSGDSDSQGSGDEKESQSVADEAEQDDSSPGGELAQVTSSRTTRGTTYPTRKRLKPKT